MNQITDPNLNKEFTFGTGFDYAVWPKSTVLTLANVPWPSEYRHIVKFADKAALNTYIDARPGKMSITGVSYTKFGQPVRINVPFEVASKFNYLRAANPAQPVPGGGVGTQRSFYYFITDVRYIAPNTTELTIQIDVWQSFGFDITFGSCYVERGHIGMAHTHQFDAFGRDYLTTPEGFDIGSEYQILHRTSQRVMRPDANDGYDILVASTTSLLAKPLDGTTPKIIVSGGGIFQGLAGGVSYWLFAGANKFMEWWLNNNQYAWQMNGIVSITAIPKISRYNPSYDYQTIRDQLPPPLGGGEWPVNIIGAPSAPLPTIQYSLGDNWRNSAEVKGKIPERYWNLKKFFTYPYMVVELTTNGGTPTILKPESWAEDNAVIVERVNMAPPAQRVVFWPRRYNAIPGSSIEDRGPLGVGYDGGEYMDKATMIANLPTMAVVNNQAALALAAQHNSIAFAESSADYSRAKATMGLSTSYDNAKIGQSLANQLTRSGVNADMEATRIANDLTNATSVASGVQSITGGGVGGATGGPAGMVAGAGMGAMSSIAGNAGAMLSTDAATAQLGNRVNAANRNAASTTAAGSAQIDNNKSLAQWAANGDYEQSIAAIQAKVQDIALTQPSTAGQVGGETFNLVNDVMEIAIVWKGLSKESYRRIGEHWLRYGYPVMQRTTPPASLMVMSKMTYWKMLETEVFGPMPEVYKNTIRGIFESGVTVWSDPADIGQIDLATNNVLGGINL